MAATLRRWKDRAEIVSDGQTVERDPWTLEIVGAPHGLFSGEVNMGVVVRVGGFAFGHPGDATRLDAFDGRGLDVMAVPISGAVTTSPAQAVAALEGFRGPLPTIVPMHWVFRSPKRFCARLRAAIPDAECRLPVKGRAV